jgi:hypothetical protein
MFTQSGMTVSGRVTGSVTQITHQRLAAPWDADLEDGSGRTDQRSTLG